jgi:uncharacterized protein involved in response to NO
MIFLFLISIISGFLATAIGVWRFRIHVQERPVLYFAAWLPVAAFSVVFAGTASLVVGAFMSVIVDVPVGKFIGRFSFGVFLFIRWLISNIVAYTILVKKEGPN